MKEVTSRGGWSVGDATTMSCFFLYPVGWGTIGCPVTELAAASRSTQDEIIPTTSSYFGQDDDRRYQVAGNHGGVDVMGKRASNARFNEQTKNTRWSIDWQD